MRLIGFGARGRHRIRRKLTAWGVAAFGTELPLRVEVQRNYGRPPAGILSRYGADLLAEVLDVAEDLS